MSRKESTEEIQRKTKGLLEQMKYKETQNSRNYLRNQIVELNLPLVTSVLMKYRPYTEDQFQLGCIGLIKATETFDVARNVPFGNYACFCIEREIQLDFHERMSTIESRLASQLIYLDEKVDISGGDELDNQDLIADPAAEADLLSFIEENELDVVCNSIVKPSIAQIAEKGKYMESKVDPQIWQDLEFKYFMETVFQPFSQKRRINFTAMAGVCGLSVQNIRMRHIRVIEIIFKRMWECMQLPFNELLARLRGTKKIPHKLLCLDPGKTTGWCLFEDGALTKYGHVEDCFDDNNINVLKLTSLFTEINPDMIVYEDYRVYSNKLERHSFNPVFTVRLIGVIETWCQTQGIEEHKQMASAAKTFCTDDKLKQWGFWQPGMKHARDAIRHGCYCLLFHKRGKDMI